MKGASHFAKNGDEDEIESSVSIIYEGIVYV